MGWFRKKTESQTEQLASQMAVAYIERARLAFQLLSIRPLLTDMETAVAWIYGAMEMRRDYDPTQESSDTQRMRRELTSTGFMDQIDARIKMTDEIARDFFDYFCQNYVDEVTKSSLKLDINSTIIKRNIDSTLKAMGPERLKTASILFPKLAANATKLAAATIAILSAGLNPVQTEEAERYAIALVNSQKNLNSFEKTNAIEGIKNLRKE